MIYVDPTGNYCVSADGKWAHAGTCNSSSSKYLGSDSNFKYALILENGKATGFIGDFGYSYYLDKPVGNFNYWDIQAEINKRIAAQQAAKLQDQKNLQSMQSFMENISGVSSVKTILSSKDPVESWIAMLSMVGPPGVPKNNFVNINTKTLISSATSAKKGGETVVGHALQKHAGRNPQIWGRIKGGPDQINQAALNHLNEIINSPGGFTKVTNPNGIQFLEKSLQDGRGVRLNLDGTFKGFIDK
ncbi:hypothetical protein [Paenibacillus sp. GXUN7292]|uniref:hypothetical protein n=1 Tax=Paenibacillus sp. GXUN7292 TaxID=3422499 RepID=UPI003D7DA28A